MKLGVDPRDAATIYNVLPRDAYLALRLLGVREEAAM